MKFAFFLSILLFTAFVDAETSTTPAQPSAASTKFEEITNDHPELSTFVLLVNKAELKDLFNGTGPFTVFAPTNEAFKKMGKDKIDHLSKPENRDQLSDLLIYHVMPGKYLSNSLKSRTAPSMNGKTLKILVENGEVKVNDAKVTQMDIIGPNGVIHEIDTVLVPSK